MERATAFFLKRPMAVSVLIVGIFGLGLQSLLTVQKEGFPEISLNKAIVQTFYPGASASDVELNVTKIIEDALSEVENVKEVLSVSREGVSVIEVQADDNATPKQFQKMLNDVENAVAAISDLPADIEGKPSISEFTSANVPVMELAYTGEYKILKPYLDSLESRLRKLPGISGVTTIGLPDQEVQIWIDAEKANRLQIDLRQVYRAIQKRNLEGSGGTLESFIGEKKIVFLNKYEKIEEILDTNIRMNDAGYGVKLKEIAGIQVLPKDKKLIVRNNGKPGATLSLRKTGTSDLVKAIDGVYSLLKNEKVPAGVKYSILFDQSKLTRDRISLLAGNAVMGFLLVISILFLIFNFKTALWTGFGIPFTLMGLFIFLKVAGISLNLISLGGFIIILGMLVDDAIVIAEEINANMEKGMTGPDAALQAIRTMWLPVAASALTTMVAFTPLLALGGFPGKFIWAIPLMVIMGLFISLAESYLLLPAHLAHGKAGKTGKKAFVSFIEQKYEKLLSWVLQYKYAFLMATLLLFVISGIAMVKFVKKDPFPQDASEGFAVSLTLPRGSLVLETEKKILQAENILREIAGKDLLGFSSRIGTESLRSDTDTGTQNNLAVIFSYLTPFSGRERTARKIITQLEKRFIELESFKDVKVIINLNRLGPPMGRPVEIRVISNDDKKRLDKVHEIRKSLSAIPGVQDIETNILDGKDELNLQINHDILTKTGLSVEDVLNTLRIAFDGVIVTKLTTVDSTIDFRLRMKKVSGDERKVLRNLPIANAQGNMIRLSLFSTFKEQPSQASIFHINSTRATTVYANTNLSIVSPIQVMQKMQSILLQESEVQISYSGQPTETAKIFSGLTSAALLAFLGVYFLIALILNSYTKPVIIMTAVPFLIPGFAFVLITHGIPGSMMSGIAMVGLMGVIVNNSILMMDKIHVRENQSGYTREIVIEAAVSRLRPILLTTLTTVLGLLPTGYGIGGSDPFLSQMSLVLAYGLLFGTGITLLILPVFLLIGKDLSGKFRGWRRVDQEISANLEVKVQKNITRRKK